jgi:amidophosphoribosyltransferase
MCGIVGLLVKKPELREQLGALMLPMLIGMTERGPDSAGLAVFTDPLEGGRRKYNLYADADAGGAGFDWQALRAAFASSHGAAELAAQGNHAILTAEAPPETVRPWLKQRYPQLYLLSAGRAIDLYKDVGSPAAVAARYDFGKLTGTHLVGHTRMATESAVTPDRAHPFTAGEDFCLVHNGSLSNPYSIRRQLEPLGIRFDTDNDTEAACRFLEWRLREGDGLETALERGFRELDGFFTFLMGTGDKMAIVRDAFACKPAVVAEHDDWVAIASEFRSLAHLPDVKNARLFEPAPEELYVWKV